MGRRDTHCGTIGASSWSLDETADPPARKAPKTEQSKRTILISKPTAEALAKLQKEQLRRSKKHMNPRGMVFPNADGGYLNLSNASYQKWKPALRAAGVPKLGLYALRHTAATALLAGGVHIKIVSERLGHTDVATLLMFYSHAMPTQQAHAAEVSGKLFG